GSTGQIRESKSKEQLLRGFPLGCLVQDVAIIIRAALDRVIEDCRIRRKSRDRKVVDVPPQRAAFQQIAGNVVEPETLAELVERLRWVHSATCMLDTWTRGVEHLPSRLQLSRSPMRSIVMSGGGAAPTTLGSWA